MQTTENISISASLFFLGEMLEKTMYNTLQRDIMQMQKQLKGRSSTSGVPFIVGESHRGVYPALLDATHQKSFHSPPKCISIFL